MREFYARVLTNKGYVTLCATSVDDAQTLVTQNRVDLAVVDFLQCGDHHYRVLEFIKKTTAYADTPVISIVEISPLNSHLDHIYRLSESVIGRGDFELPRFYTMIDNLLEQCTQRRNDTSDETEINTNDKTRTNKSSKRRPNATLNASLKSGVPTRR